MKLARLNMKYLYLILADFFAFGGMVKFFMPNASFEFQVIYLVYFIPIYHILRGILTRIIFKKIWFPNLLYLIVSWTITLGVMLLIHVAYVQLIITTVIPFIISLFASLITAKIIKTVHLKKSKN